MAGSPPFSLDPLEAIPPTDTDYVDKYARNNDRFEAEIIRLWNQQQSFMGGSPPLDQFSESGQLEVNGHFLVHRRMQELARQVTVPLDGAYVPSPDFDVIDDGTGLGIVGAGTYSYHPTICPGWYAPRQLMLASTGAVEHAFGRQPDSGGLGLQLDIQAGTRLFNTSNEAVIFQPVSVHMAPERFQGRTNRLQIEYETDAVAPDLPWLYVAWTDGVTRFKERVELVSSGLGVRERAELFFTIPAGVRTLEIGVEVHDPAAHVFIFRQVTCSSNVRRGLDNTFPGVLVAEQLLIETLYYRNVGGTDGVDFLFPEQHEMDAGGQQVTIPALGDIAALYPPLVLTVGSGYIKRVPSDSRRPVIAPTAYTSGGSPRWTSGNANVYARPLLIEHIAPISANTLQKQTDAATCELEFDDANDSVTPMPYDDWPGLNTFHLNVRLSIGAVAAGYAHNPDLMIRYFGEYLTTFKPLLLT